MDVTSTEVTFERVDELPILHGLQQLKLGIALNSAEWVTILLSLTSSPY
jgi:hypothetical protein